MKRSAFTLLEVIIVIIIIGVLASLALPKLFSVVEGVKAVEAVSMISSIRASMERCYLMNNGTYENCFLNNGGYTLDIKDPSDAPGSHFNYAARGNAGHPNSYWIGATPKTFPLYGICMTQGVRICPSAIDVCLFAWDLDDGRIYWKGHGYYKNFVPKSE